MNDKDTISAVEACHKIAEANRAAEARILAEAERARDEWQPTPDEPPQVSGRMLKSGLLFGALAWVLLLGIIALVLHLLGAI